MNNGSVSDLGPRINGYVGLDDAIRPDSNSPAQEAISTYTRISAKNCAFTYNTESPDRYLRRKSRSRFDDRIRMNPRITPFGRIEQRDCPHKRQFGLLCNQECLARLGAPGELASHNSCRTRCECLR